MFANVAFPEETSCSDSASFVPEGLKKEARVNLRDDNLKGTSDAAIKDLIFCLRQMTSMGQFLKMDEAELSPLVD